MKSSYGGAIPDRGGATQRPGRFASKNAHGAVGYGIQPSDPAAAQSKSLGNKPCPGFAQRRKTRRSHMTDSTASFAFSRKYLRTRPNSIGCQPWSPNPSAMNLHDHIPDLHGANKRRHALNRWTKAATITM
jgi:hypothetical protein